MLLDLTDRVTSIVESAGYPGIAALLFTETLFPPIPSEVILPLAGYVVGQGRLNLIGVLFAATLGSVSGALALYGIAYWFGLKRLLWFVQRWGRYALVSEDDLYRSFTWFDRHSSTAVFVGRLVPGIRSLISLPAGVTRMPLPRFIAYTTCGSLIWNTTLVGLGWWLQSRWTIIEEYISYIQYGVIAVILLVVLRFAWQRRALLATWTTRQ